MRDKESWKDIFRWTWKSVRSKVSSKYRAGKNIAPDVPHFIPSMPQTINTHNEFVKEYPNAPELNQYYVFATFMPPGESKMIVTFDDLFEK